MELWNEICFLINEHRTRGSAERDFQIEAENMFEKLGWSRYRDEIISQKVIPIGSAQNLKPDIIIKSEGKNVIVVELKKPSVDIIDRNAQQLISYMLQLKLRFGLLIGDTIQLYYDEPENDERPEQVLEVPFKPDDDKGNTLIGQLTKQSFSPDGLATYCKELVVRKHDKEKADALAQRLLTEDGQAQIVAAISDALSGQYSKDIAAAALDKLNIKVVRKPSVASQTSTPEQAATLYSPHKNHKPRQTTIPAIPADDPYPTLKVGQLANTVIRRLLETEMVPPDEVERLQDVGYSKRVLGLSSYPLIVPANSQFEWQRFYHNQSRDPLNIYGQSYYLCSQWFAQQRPQMLRWIAEHSK
ncbi:MAG: GxxExxY protein [Coriobacteriales bacterium]|jgi:hypothetical protein|nr:GxxExxY protein [Coriobacteriales bacterium]